MVVSTHGNNSATNVSGMSNHPSLQPTLGASNVRSLVRAMHALTPPRALPDEYQAGYRAGVTAAVDQLLMLWQSAEIAARAVADEIADQLDHPTPSLDHLDELSDIADALLDVKKRLDQLDQDEDEG